MKTQALLMMLLFYITAIFAQNDTMYIMKNGLVTHEYNIETGVDSVVFYHVDPPPPPAELKIALFGDSITHGAPGQGMAYYRKPLYYLLTNAGYTIDYVGHRTDWGLCCGDDPDNDWDRDHSAQWGISAASVASSLNSYLSQYATPDVALIHLGTNDFGDGTSIRNAYISMINTLRAANPNIVVFLAQIIKANHSGVMQTISYLQPMVVELVANMNTPQSPIIIVDQFTDFNVSTDLQDSLHPNWAGANKMANKWFEAIDGHYGN